MGKSASTEYLQIFKTLVEINEIYENQDSIFVIPVPEEKFKKMKLIGKNISFDVITNEPRFIFI